MQQRSTPRIVLLAGPGASTNIVYHALEREFGEITVIIEERLSRQQLIKRRLKKLGVMTVAGQILFMTLAEPWLRKRSRTRIAEIKREYSLDDSPIKTKVINVPSVNSDEARQVLKQLDPQIVIVNGTRIISKETLAATKVTFINTHAGITPTFRGVHGGYWAIAERRPELAGTTVHLIDTGIDTGGILKQRTFDISPADSFATYPYLHLAVGIPALLESIHEIMNNNLKRQKIDTSMPSQLRYHPTLWGYIFNRITRSAR